MPYTSAIGFPDTELIQATAEANRERAGKSRRFSPRRLASAGISAEWRSIESFSGDTAHAGVDGRTRCDLVIASQAAPDAATDAPTSTRCSTTPAGRCW